MIVSLFICNVATEEVIICSRPKAFVDTIHGILQDRAFAQHVRDPYIYPLCKLCKCSFTGPVNLIL